MPATCSYCTYSHLLAPDSLAATYVRQQTAADNLRHSALENAKPSLHLLDECN